MKDEVIQLVADFLKNKEIDLNVAYKQNGWDCHILHKAAFQNQSDLIRLLVAMGADVNASIGNSGNALLWAVGSAHAHYEAIKALIECGVDVNASDANGTALKRAIIYGYDDIAKLLREHGAKE